MSLDVGDGGVTNLIREIGRRIAVTLSSRQHLLVESNETRVRQQETRE